MAIVNGKKLAAGAVEGQEKLEESKSLPVLFLYNVDYNSYIPNSYSQVFTKEVLLKDKLSKQKFPIEVLWVDKNLVVDDGKDSNCSIDLKDLAHFSSVGCLAKIERIEEFLDNSLRLNIATQERIKIYDITLNQEGLYYGKYVSYAVLPIKGQEKEQVLGIIEEIKAKYVTLKSLKPERVGDLEFPVKLNSQTIEEYASLFSLDAICLFKDHNTDYVHELFVTQNVVLRLQGILLKIVLLIEGNK